MYLENQEKEWLTAIKDKNVNNLQSFIDKFCDINTEHGNGKMLWDSFEIEKKEMIIPKDEENFLVKLNLFVRLIEKMLALGVLNYNYKNIDKKGMLPIFKKGGRGFVEVYEILSKYQGYILVTTPIFEDFVQNNYLTEQEKRYYDEQKLRKSSQRWTISIAIAAIIAQALTAITLYYLNSKREIQLTNLTQKLAYYNAVAQKKISSSEDIIRYRQQALDWLDKYKLLNSEVEKKNQLEKWFEISKNIGVSNSVSLLYAQQPYNAIMNFDDKFKDLILLLEKPGLKDSTYYFKRKELGTLFQDIIDGLYKNTIGDSAYILFKSKNYFDTDRKK